MKINRIDTFVFGMIFGMVLGIFVDIYYLRSPKSSSSSVMTEPDSIMSPSPVVEPEVIYITPVTDSIKWVCTRMDDQEDYTCTLRMIP